MARPLPLPRAVDSCFFEDDSSPQKPVGLSPVVGSMLACSPLGSDESRGCKCKQDVECERGRGYERGRGRATHEKRRLVGRVTVEVRLRVFEDGHAEGKGGGGESHEEGKDEEETHGGWA